MDNRQWQQHRPRIRDGRNSIFVGISHYVLYLVTIGAVKLTIAPEFRRCHSFSIGNVVSNTSTRYMTPSLLSSTVQAIEAVTGYLALGYILWLALRSYEQ